MNWTLRRLIIVVALTGVVLTGIGSFSGGYQVSKDVLLSENLETNRVYAEKLAITTNNHLKTMLKILKYNSGEVSGEMIDNNQQEQLNAITNRIRKQTETFNTVVISNEVGKIIAASDDSIDLIGLELASVGVKQALTERTSLISAPYTGSRGRNVIFLSSPIYNDKEQYIGFIGGAIYLEEENVLSSILGQHFYEDGSYVYVVDHEGRIIYHEDPERINEVIVGNKIVEEVTSGKDGAQRVINTKGVDVLAGYAYIPASKWGVVSQRPTDVTLLPSKQLLQQMITKSVPLLLLSLIIIVVIARQISRPLNELATYAKRSTEDNNDEAAIPVTINAWYYEAIELKKALLDSVTYFQGKVNYFIHESTTDPLTGLKNRRALDNMMNKWHASNRPFSFIILDIDKFKRVNDRYGHSVGDDVLVYLAYKMKENIGEGNFCYRFGGEEFVILLPNTSIKDAFQVAEKLRKELEVTESPCGEIITISSGIAHMPDCSQHLVELIEKADKRLYHAKDTGRNKTVMYDEELE